METNEKEDLVRAEYKDGNIVITMPAKLLEFFQNTRPYGNAYGISNIDEMGAWIAAHIVEFEEQEDGTTRLYQLIDDLFDSAYEDGQEWLTEIEAEE